MKPLSIIGEHVHLLLVNRLSAVPLTWGYVDSIGALGDLLSSKHDVDGVEALLHSDVFHQVGALLTRDGGNAWADRVLPTMGVKDDHINAAFACIC